MLVDTVTALDGGRVKCGLEAGYLDVEAVVAAPVPGAGRFGTSADLPLPLDWISILFNRLPFPFDAMTGDSTFDVLGADANVTKCETS